MRASSVVDNGDTPLHVACFERRVSTIDYLLALHPPILMRNKAGKTPRDAIPLLTRRNAEIKRLLDQYMKDNKDKIFADYNKVMKMAKLRFSHAERLTRIFVIGYPGAGKSSLVETLKREGFFEAFKQVSEASVPLHTAGIVPSIHTSKHYGRVLFYDFAGDAEYYSSHAAILESLTSSSKGDNLFIIVADLREERADIKRLLWYWLSFIQHQKFSERRPFLLLVGSHTDGMAEKQVKDSVRELENFCKSIEPGQGISNKVEYFVGDCRDPKGRHISAIRRQIASLTKDSPHHQLSLHASILLGLLEKDFSQEPSLPCPSQPTATSLSCSSLLSAAQTRARCRG